MHDETTKVSTGHTDLPDVVRELSVSLIIFTPATLCRRGICFHYVSVRLSGTS